MLVYVFIYGGLIAIIVASLFRRDRARRRDDMLTAILFAAFSSVGAFSQLAIIHYTPTTLDPLLLHIDHAIAFDTFSVAHWLFSQASLRVVLINSYNLLSIMLGVAWISEQSPATRLSCLLGGFIAILCYAAFPAVGPRHYEWVANAPQLSARNCVPSMHLTWAFLIAINARAWPLRLLFWIYVCLMILATIGLGEHYLIDLLLAIPYTIAIQRLTVRLLERPVQRKAAAAASEFVANQSQL